MYLQNIFQFHKGTIKTIMQWNYFHPLVDGIFLQLSYHLEMVIPYDVYPCLELSCSPSNTFHIMDAFGSTSLLFFCIAYRNRVFFLTWICHYSLISFSVCILLALIYLKFTSNLGLYIVGKQTVYNHTLLLHRIRNLFPPQFLHPFV